MIIEKKLQPREKNFKIKYAVLATVQIFAYFLLFTIICSCGGQNRTSLQGNNATDSDTNQTTQNTTKEIVHYKAGEGVTCSIQDEKGDLWFGTNNEGIYRYDGTNFFQFTTNEGLVSNVVTSMIEDKKGNIWLGTDNGLCKYDGKVFIPIPIPWDGNEDLWGEGMNANKVLCVTEDSQGLIWFGTWGGGAYSYDGETFISFLKNEGKKQDNGEYRHVIQSILEDNEGNIWFTSMTHGGIYRYDGENMDNFSQKEGLGDDMFFSSHLDKNGDIWFGSLGNREAGLVHYNGTTFVNFDESNGLDTKNVVCIYKDSKSRLWIGSMRGKLTVYEPNNSSNPTEMMFEPFSTEKGETLDHILDIFEDDKGNMWFGGQYGQLFQFDGQILTDFTQKGRI